MRKDRPGHVGERLVFTEIMEQLMPGVRVHLQRHRNAPVLQFFDVLLLGSSAWEDFLLGQIL